MAGIGFELKKAFKGNSITKKAWGYSCAAIVVAGPTVLVIIMLLVLNMIGSRQNNTDWGVLTAFITYAMIGSLLASSVLNALTSRYSADALFKKSYDRVIPSFYGSALVLITVFGIIYGIILSTAEGVSLTDRVLNWFDWAIMLVVYIEMGYLTAIKKYTLVVMWFFIGVASVILSALLYIRVLGLSDFTGIEAALFTGYGVMFFGFASTLHAEFPAGRGSVFAFLEYADKYPSFCLIGTLQMLMSFIHIFIMWGGEYGTHVTGLFYSAPVYDVCAFYGFLVAIPTNVLFVVSVETKFYEKFHIYFSAVSGNGNIKDMAQANRDMTKTLKNEVVRIELIQLLVLILYMVFMRFYLVTIGFTQSILIMFYLLSIGYAAFGVGTVLVQLLLYFDYRKGALITNASGFAVTLAVTLLVKSNPSYYGLGMAAGGIVHFLTGLIFLSLYMRDVDEHVFMSQPIFAFERDNRFLRFIRKLDGKEILREEKYKQKADKAEKEK